VGKDDPEPDFAGMNTIPKELNIAGKRFAAQKAAFTDNRLDLGAGADCWMKWCVNREIPVKTSG